MTRAAHVHTGSNNTKYDLHTGHARIPCAPTVYVLRCSAGWEAHSREYEAVQGSGGCIEEPPDEGIHRPSAQTQSAVLSSLEEAPPPRYICVCLTARLSLMARVVSITCLSENMRHQPITGACWPGRRTRCAAAAAAVRRRDDARAGRRATGSPPPRPRGHRRGCGGRR